jgi:hypothetical protein
MTVCGRASCRFLVFIAATVAFAVPCLAQSAAPAALQLPLVYSTTPMTRNADLMLSASILATSAADVGLTALSPPLFRGPRFAARVARATKLALFDLPVVVYFVGLNHEWGHQTRSTEYGVDSQLSLTGTPWSSNPFRLWGLEPFPEDPLVTAAIHGGGLEASHQLKDRAEARMLRAERVAPGHALASIVASLDAPLYALRDLSPGTFGDGRPGDVITLVTDLHDRRSALGTSRLEDLRHHVRTRTMLNLLDAALWSETAGLLGDHLWRGEADVRVRWLPIAGVRVLPSMRYELSPLGPEYYVRTLYRAFGASGTAYGRWTERIGPDRQVGGGFSLSRWSTPRILPRVSPTVTIDAWSHTVDGFGLRGEVAADVRGWPAQRAALTVAAGAKSSGYLAGFAMDGGPYITAGVTVKVW